MPESISGGLSRFTRFTQFHVSRFTVFTVT
jgi:hypothetical protein